LGADESRPEFLRQSGYPVLTAMAGARKKNGDRRRPAGGPSISLCCGVLLSLVIGFSAIGFPGQAKAAEEAASEYAVKAAFLYNFTKFVEWPAAAFVSEQQPFFLCILGADPFGAALDAVAGKPVGSRKIELRHLKAAEQAGTCQIVFVAAGEAWSGNRLLDGKAILTVSDAPGFASRGGVIGFVVVEGHVRFEINPMAAARANLTIKSQLMRLATIVKEGE